MLQYLILFVVAVREQRNGHSHQQIMSCQEFLKICLNDSRVRRTRSSHLLERD